jgi:hypothetical protein
LNNRWVIYVYLQYLLEISKDVASDLMRTTRE